MSTFLAEDATPAKNGTVCTSKTIPYKTSGTGSATVLFIHGFMDAGNIWESVIQEMNPRKYRFVTLDLPFMGRLSESQREVSLDAMAEAVADVVDELDKPIVLVGQSMGAQIAELAARSRPGAIDSMVLVTPVPLIGLPVSDEFVAAMQSMANNESMQLEYRRSVFPELPEKELKKYARNGARIAAHNITALISAWSKGHPAALLPGPQDMPILIIGGAADDACTPTVLKSLVAPRFAMSKTVFLPRARHWPHIESPGEIAIEIEQFLTADALK
jgi:esterase